MTKAFMQIRKLKKDNTELRHIIGKFMTLLALHEALKAKHNEKLK